MTEHAPQLLENIPDDVIAVTSETVPADSYNQVAVTRELVQKTVAWDKRNRVLSIARHVLIKDIAEGRKSLHAGNIPSVRYILNLLIKKGFSPDN